MIQEIIMTFFRSTGKKQGGIKSEEKILDTKLDSKKYVKSQNNSSIWKEWM